MICKVREAVERYKMPLKGRTVAVGVSGGADSMSLLHALLELREELGMNIIACHVNHGIRGETADRDESFVVDACKRLGVECRVLRADVPSKAKEMHLGVEECGRKIRYDFFNSVAENVVIATAHTLSDRCETLLLNIARGASVKGLCSIPPVRGNIVRPLIDCTRDDIESYCKENSIDFVTDETNFDDVYSRNRIRLNVIPQLKALNPSLEKAFLRLIRNAEEENGFMTDFSLEILGKVKLNDGYDAKALTAQHTAVRKRVIFEIVKDEIGIIPEAVHVEQIEKILHGGRTEIIGNTVVEVKKGKMRFNPVAEKSAEWEVDFSLDGTETPTGIVKSRIIHRNNLPQKHFVHNKVLDYDSIVGRPVLRNRRQGDKIRLAGSSCTKTLKKLFNEKHIENRNSVSVLADELGICWVQGLGCADRCKIKPETEKILIIGEDKQND